MKHILRILLFLLITLAGFTPLQAQWEQIGWQGGKINVEVQLGNTLYGTGNYSVYKSTDWGITWSIFTKGLPVDRRIYQGIGGEGGNFRIKNDMIYFHINANTVSGLIFCKEADTQWTFIPISKIKNQIPQSNPGSTEIITSDSIFTFMYTDSVKGFFLSTDAGITWTKRMNGLPNGLSIRTLLQGRRISAIISFFDTIENKYSANNFISYDFGATWIRPPFSFFDSIFYGFYLITDSTLFATTSDFSLYRSTNSGDSWIELDDPLPKKHTHYKIDFLTDIGNKTFFSIYTGSEFGIHTLFCLDDSGFHWKKIRSDSLWYSSIAGKDNRFILSTVYSGSFTTDSSFSIISPLISTDVFANNRKLVCVSGRKLFALPHSDDYSNDPYDSIFVSKDNGSTWSQQLFFDQNKLDHNLWVQDGMNIYCSGITKDSLTSIFCSTDQGNSWKSITTFSSKEQISSFFVNGDTMVAGFKSGLVLSIDGGKSWVIDRGHPVASSIKLCYREGILLLVYNESGINYSLDFGNSWILDDGILYADLQYFEPYVYGGRIFLPADEGRYSKSFHTVFKAMTDSLWKKTYGLDTNLVCIPGQNDNGILYATGSVVNGNASATGHTALYYSLDSGANWKQLGDYVTNSSDVFIGSDYIFLAGPTELWRGPKPTIPSGVASTKNISSISIGDCYPNPAKSEMRISYSIPKRSDVVLSVFDITGKEIAKIAREVHDAGSYEKLWDARMLPNGSYILKLSACGESVTKVIEVVK